MAVGMQATSFIQKFEVSIAQMNVRMAEGSGEFAAPLSVAVILRFIDSAAVVK